MPSSYASLLYHIVFSTKYRKPSLTDLIRPEVYNYIGGIVANKKGHILEIGGTDDHVHILTACSPTIALAEFVRDIKANSSKWLHEERLHRDVQWQTGYGAFTVSYSQTGTIRQYLCNQTKHHGKQSYDDEFRAILGRARNCVR